MPKPPPTRSANAATVRSPFAVRERREVALEIGVAEQQPTRRRRALRRGQRLSLTATREAQHDRACVLGKVRGAVA